MGGSCLFKTDKPIQSYKEDILDRRYFANHLAQSILAYNDKESLVIGLFGKWGSGKSSIINMVTEYIQEIENKKPQSHRSIIIPFNPWNFSQQDQIIKQFFKILGAKLNKEYYGEKLQKASNRIKSYGTVFDDTVSLLPDIGGLPGVISLLFKISGSLTKALEKYAFGSDVNEDKEELDRLLREQPRKIIIVMDDIDRLNHSEIVQIFQLVKVIADFPNTIYVLSFDKDIVVSALNEFQKVPGNKYLEKIIQVGFDVPLSTRSEIEKILLSKFKELLDDMSESDWNNIHFGNVFHSGVKDFFENIRDIIRFLNTLGFGYKAVYKEVNPVDFFAITAVQVFEPMVYEAIRNNKEVFTGAAVYHSTEEQLKARCEEILDKSSNSQRESLKQLLMTLFPKLEKYYKNTSYDKQWLGSWRKQSRICSPDVFDIYFKLHLPAGEISNTYMKEILLFADDFEAFRDMFVSMINDGKVTLFLNRLDDYIAEERVLNNPSNIIAVLADFGEMFPKAKDIFLFGATGQAASLIYRLLRELKDPRCRFETIKSAMVQSSNGLIVLVRFISIMNGIFGRYAREEEALPEDKRLISEDELDILQQMVVTRIEQWVIAGKLLNHNEFITILYNWKDWQANKGDVERYVSELIEADENLIEFLNKFNVMSTVQNLSDHVAQKVWRLDMKGLGKFISIDRIEPRVRKIFQSKDFEDMENKKKLSIRNFLDAYDGKVSDW
jgi:predicted KAP-like P-loop ATPase